MSVGFPQPIFLWHANNDPYQDELGLVTSSDYSIAFMHHGTHFIRYTFPVQEVSLLEIDYRLSNEVWHEIEVSTYDGMLKVWLDGEELLAYLDPDPLPPGTIGIGLGESMEEGSKVYYDNLRVCELTSPFVSQFAQEP